MSLRYTPPPPADDALSVWTRRGPRRPKHPPRLLLIAAWVFAGTSGFFGCGGSHMLVPDWSETAHAATSAGGELLGLVGLFIAAASIEGGFEGPVGRRKK